MLQLAQRHSTQGVRDFSWLSEKDVLPSAWIQSGSNFPTKEFVEFSSFYRVWCVNTYQPTWTYLQSHASWVPTCPIIQKPHSCHVGCVTVDSCWFRNGSRKQLLKRHGPPNKTWTVFESKALISVVLPCEATISAKLSLLTRCPVRCRGLVELLWSSELLRGMP